MSPSGTRTIHITTTFIPNRSSPLRTERVGTHVRGPTKITLHMRPQRRLRLICRPPPAGMSVERYSRVDAWVQRQVEEMQAVKDAAREQAVNGLPTPPTTVHDEVAATDYSESTASTHTTLAPVNTTVTPPNTAPATATTATSSLTLGRANLLAGISNYAMNAALDVVYEDGEIDADELALARLVLGGY